MVAKPEGGGGTEGVEDLAATAVMLSRLLWVSQRDGHTSLEDASILFEFSPLSLPLPSRYLPLLVNILLYFSMKRSIC